MNIELPEKSKFSKRDKIIYISAIAICIIAIGLVIYLEIFSNESLTNTDKKPQTTDDISSVGSKTEEMEDSLKAEFDNIFKNQISSSQTPENIKKIDDSKKIVYTLEQKKEEKEKSYNVDINIPYINIANDTIKKYNAEIAKVFKAKLDSVLQEKDKNIIYTVEYTADIQNDILSLMIRSNLKEGSSAQRVIIQTYNYDLKENKEVSLSDLLNKYQLNAGNVQTKINDEIKQAQQNVEALQNVGYTIHSRDLNSSEYKIENTKEFYITQNSIYIMYPYGNNTFTSEMDLVIL